MSLSLKDQLIRASRDLPSSSATETIDIESPNYDPLNDLLNMFSHPNSLADLDDMMSYTNTYKLQLEEEIHSKNKSYLNQSNNDPLVQLDSELTQLIDQFDITETLAQSTGVTINDMTINIKKLDNCKKNLTLSMTILKRLQMLIISYDSLNDLISEDIDVKNYSEIKQMLSVVLELMQHFQTYKSIDEVNTLNKRIGSIKNKIIDEIFNDFEKDLNGHLKNTQLINGCEILDLLGRPYHDKLSNWYMNNVLKDITTIFKSSEEAGSLDNLKRRFIYFQRILANFEKNKASLFPFNWKMNLELTKRFCELTKKDLKEVTSKETRLNGSSHVDVNLLIGSLSESLEFENYLNVYFKNEDYNFDSKISDVFEPYLNIWIKYQGTLIEKKFLEFLNPNSMFKKSGVSDENTEALLNVLESSADLFRMYRSMLTQLSKLSHGDPLIKLSETFAKYLDMYQKQLLETMLPDQKQLVSGNSNDQIEVIDIICLVLNTADYCSITIGQLEERMISLVSNDEQLIAKINFEKQINNYLNTITKCMNLMYLKIENDLQLSWREMSNFNWKTLKDVTGESRYLHSIKTVLTENCELIFKNFNRPLYLRNFIDKLIEIILNDLIINMIKLKPISDVMAEQLLLDLQTLKSFFYELPELASSATITSVTDKNNNEKSTNGTTILASSFTKNYKKYVNSKIDKIDKLLKILMAPLKPTDAFIINYFKIIGDRSFSNFVKVLKLKGKLNNDSSFENDKFKYMDIFRTQLRSYQETILNTENEEELSESDGFLEQLKIDVPIITTLNSNTANTLNLFSSSLLSSPSASTSMLPGGSSPNIGGSNGPNLSNLFDRQSLQNTRDNFEKNFAKTFGISEDNKKNLNENLTKFGKLFKKNFD